MRGWPSFDTETFDLLSQRLDAANWPSTRTYQLLLAQTPALKFHYGENIARSRLLNAALVLRRHRGPYGPAGVDDVRPMAMPDRRSEAWPADLHAAATARGGRPAQGRRLRSRND